MEKKPHHSPVAGKEWKTLYFATEGDIECAIKCAAENPLQGTHPYQRAPMLSQVATMIEKNKETLATLITLEMGKPITSSRGEVDYAASYFTWFAEEAKRIYGYNMPSSSPNKRLSVSYIPIGPCALITPWNFPLAMSARKIAPAIAAGCPVIAKPSPETPITLLALAELCVHCGIPPAALQVLIGDEEKIGSALLASDVIRKLSFTGSCQVGKLLYRESANNLKKLTLELGGLATFIVFEDADLDKAIEGILHAKLRNSGQTCVSGNRFFIHKQVEKEFLKRYIEKVQSLKVGTPLDEATDLTTKLHPQSIAKVKAHLADALNKGAKPHLHAKHPYQVEVLTSVTADMLLFHEETFGPLAGFYTFTEEDKALTLANDSPYGLAGYIFTESLSRAHRAISALSIGIIGLNDGKPSAAHIPFGGVKASGFGSEGGREGIYEYLNLQLISEKF